MRMIVVTGLSGSGRSAALKSFEDMGFYCVDNLPLVLLSAFVEFAKESKDANRSAIGIDIREKGFPERFPVLYNELKKRGTGFIVTKPVAATADHIAALQFSRHVFPQKRIHGQALALQV